jgi:raffinose/stachyose/melibiose transport system substrate-binding protein
MEKTTIRIFSVVLILALLITGCNNGTPETKSAPKVTLKIGGIEYAYTKAATEEFRKRNPDIDVKLENGLQSVDDGTVQALLKSGAGPDLIVVNSGPGRIGALTRDKLIRPVNDIYKKLNLEDRYLKNIMDQIKAQDKDGNIYEFLEGTDVYQIYYNKQMFKELNITSPPETWADFLTICQKLKDAKIKPIAAGFKGAGVGAGWLGGLLLESAAGKDRMADVIFKGASFNQEPFKLGFEMLKELVDKGYINGQEALALNNDEAGSGFYHNQFGMFGTTQAVILRDKAKNGIDTTNFGSFYLPSREAGRPGLPTAGLAQSWVVSAAASPEKMPAIEKWVDFISSTDYLKVTMQNGAQNIPALKQIPNDTTVDPIITDAINKSAKGAGFNPSVYFPSTSKAAWFAALQAVVGGSMTPTDAVKSIDEAFQKR